MDGVFLLALADPPPNQDALALAPVAGWIMLWCAACLAAVFIVHRETWRRWFLVAEDPRTMAAFRIAFGFCCLCNINGMWELFGYLFTDEGLFLSDTARQHVAAEQFAGFGNGYGDDGYGFFDARAALQWLKGPKYSLLLFWDSPTAFWIHLWAFEIAMISTIIGWQTRWMKWIAWFLFHSIIQRNNVFWEGTENVYRTFFFYLCLSRCDRAWSVDNWLRCRRLRRQDKLSETGGPGLEAIYRRIPAWPRILLILQSAALYCYTGAVKNGQVWWQGDAFYYALNLDHFYRVPPQELSALLGTTLFRVNTHVVHIWEMMHWVVVIGLVLRVAHDRKVASPPPRERWIARLGWIGLALGVLALVVWLFPVHYARPAKSWWTIERVQVAFALAWTLVMGLIAWGYRRLRDRPIRWRLRGRTIVFDVDWLARWVLGRRLWLGLGVVFHLHVVILMNIGWFQFGAMTGFIAYLSGHELATMVAILGRWLRLPVRCPPIPCEDPSLPHLAHDDVRLSRWVLWTAWAFAIAGVPLQVAGVLHYGWTLVSIAAFLAGAAIREARRGATPREPATPPELAWAYGPLGRFVANSLVIFQIVGVACWLLPDKSCFVWRKYTHEPFKVWLQTTQTSQGWKMFAPNPPRGNVFLRVLVTDADGQIWDLDTDVYAESQRPNPWIWYTRQRKINRRIAGGEGGKGTWYQKWHARWVCRDWTLTHDGIAPEKVELVKVSYPIPSPDEVAKHGPYDPWERLATKGSQSTAYTAHCPREEDAQPPNYQRIRHGLEPVEAGVKRWSSVQRKKAAWERKLAREAAEEDNDQDE